MPEREIPNLNYDNETRNKILDVATELFALKGVNAVSVRDIAKAVGIKMSSIYYHYKSKESLIEDVLSRFENGYRLYVEWQTSVNEKAESVEELMDNMFNEEFLNMQNPSACFGMTIAIKEQHNNESARRCVFELFYQHSINSIQADFDRLIQKGIIPSSDTKMLATLFMFNVLVSNDMSIHEYIGVKPTIDRKEMFNKLRKFMTAALIHGDPDQCY